MYPDHKTVKTIPEMILEVTVEFTNLTTFSNFPHMFLQAKTHGQKIFEHDVDFINWWLGRQKGSVHKSSKNRSV